MICIRGRRGLRSRATFPHTDGWGLSPLGMGAAGLRFGFVGGEPEVKDLIVGAGARGFQNAGPAARKGRRASCGLQGEQSPRAPSRSRVRATDYRLRARYLKLKVLPPRGWKRRGVTLDWLGTDSSPSHVPERRASTFGGL